MTDEKMMGKRLTAANKVFWIIVIAAVLVIITPDIESEPSQSPEDIKLSDIMPTKMLDRQEIVQKIISDLLAQGYKIVDNNFPTAITLRWKEPVMEGNPASKAMSISKNIYDQTQHSIRIIIIVGEQKYSGYYRPSE